MSTKAEEEFKKLLINDLTDSILVSSLGASIQSRGISIYYDQTKNWFYSYTSKSSTKIGQIPNNTNVALIHFTKDDHPKTTIFQASAVINSEHAAIAHVWKDDWKNFGFTGPTDPNGTLIIYTIHSSTSGKETNAGIQTDYKSYESVVQTKQIDLLTPHLAESIPTAIKTSISTFPNFQLITLGATSDFHSRPVTIDYSETHGFYSVTCPSTQKVSDLLAHPYVSLHSIKGFETGGQTVISALAELDYSGETKEALWKDSYKGYGIANAESAEYLVIRYTPLTVYEHGWGKPTNILSVSAPPYLQAEEKLHTLLQKQPAFSLATVDAEQHPHSRSIEVRYLAPFGFLSVTHASSEKVKQIQTHPYVSLYQSVDGTISTFEAYATLVKSPALNHLLWNDQYKAFGFTGPTDASLQIILYNLSLASSFTLAPGCVPGAAPIYRSGFLYEPALFAAEKAAEAAGAGAGAEITVTEKKKRKRSSK